MGGPPPLDELIQKRAQVVAVIEVCVEALGTNESPPRTRVRIVEVLRGLVEPGERDAFFPRPADESFYAIRQGGDTGLERWKKMGLGSPPRGKRFIVGADLRPDGTLDVVPRTLRPCTEDERARLRALLEGER